MDKLLQKYDCAPSPAGKEWAQKFWKDEEKVVERIEQCRALHKLKVGKGKNVMCAVLGACLSCAQEEAKNAGETLKTHNNKLQSENRALRSQIDRLTGHNYQLKQMMEMVSGLLDKMQPSATVDQEETLIPLRPLIKTEVTDKGNDEIHTTIRATAWSPTELMNLKEKYSRRAGESETEYLWRVSLQGGDMIMLSEEEAGGFWGPGVFLTTTPGEHHYSLTARVAHWAGGIDPRERGEPLSIQAASYSDLAEAVQKAACIQAMYNRDDLRKSPMTAAIDPDRLNPLIRGLPDCLKTFVVTIRDRIRDGSNRRGQRAYSLTWSKFVHEIDQYGREMGWVSSSREKPSEHTRKVRQVHTRNSNYNQNRAENPTSNRFYTHNSNFDGKFRFNKERNDLWRKALDLGVPRHILHGIKPTRRKVKFT
uniref:Uncharacterized protein n=1 Tax=Amazona collaria TaxID=241587 RepID=A0A8B9J1F9_9PSIT